MFDYAFSAEDYFTVAQITQPSKIFPDIDVEVLRVIDPIF